MEETAKDRYAKAVQVRIINEDNPQYVLGWNACRYLSEEFLLQEAERARGEEEQKWRKLIKANWDNPLTLLDN